MIRTGSITSSERTGTSPQPSSAGASRRQNSEYRPGRAELAKSGRRGRAEYGSKCPARSPLASLGHLTNGELCREQADLLTALIEHPA